MPADLFRPLHARNLPRNQRLSTLSIEGVITSLQFGERHVFDFYHGGETHRCMVVFRLLMDKDLQVGQRVELTGRWSPMVANLFEACAVAVARDLEESAAH